ncbi:MAG: hypothetical protein OHK0022_33930 [Roseiflexaceae bacterium]
MLKRHKDLLRAVVAPLRATLAGAALPDGGWQRGDLDRELERLGIAEDGALTPLDALPGATVAERRARYAAEAAIGQAVNGQKGAEAAQRRRTARAEVVERAAYTWINRLLALRAMEARNLIDETLRANPDYEGLSEALFVLRSSAPARAAGADGGWWAVLEDACQAQSAALPGLFDLHDPAAALRPSTPALLRCVALVGAPPSGFMLDEADAAFADPDAIGWAYQFYQEAAKAAVYKKLGAGGKASSRAEIAAATQLFTEPYMVQWLLQNSLGRSYHEAYPDSRLPGGWDYYIRQRPEGQRPPETPRPLHALDLIDPCCGSGHFLREAFDMFAAMYREQHPELGAAEIADRILARHLHGIDLDPRAAQLAALTLYLRAWELVRDEARRQRRALPSYRPAALHIATTPSGLSAGALARHLGRHPEDRVMQPLLEGVFAALEQAGILGSLLRPSEHLDAAIRALQQPHTMRMDFDADDAALRSTITALAHSDPAELKRLLLERVAASFRAEAGSADDVAAQLFGREVEGGLRLLQLLDRQYAVVVTNPPYMGSKNMDAPLKKLVERDYKPGKRDLYAAFILRCLELCNSNGRVVMITQHSWMFLRSFTDLRTVSEDKVLDFHEKRSFLGLLRSVAIEDVAHLGSSAFEEISGEVVQNAMFVLKNTVPSPDYRVFALRLVGLKSPVEKANMLRGKTENNIFTPLQSGFLLIPDSPITYWMGSSIFRSFTVYNLVGNFYSVSRGVDTCNNERFLRGVWEIYPSKRWLNYRKSGGYKKWDGLNQWLVDWNSNGSALKNYVIEKFPYLKGNYEWLVKESTFFKYGWTYSLVARGSLGLRRLEGDCACDNTSPAVFADLPIEGLGALLNCRFVSFLLRGISSDIKFREGYVSSVPVLSSIPFIMIKLEEMCVVLKRCLVITDLTERIFSGVVVNQPQLDAVATLLHTLEGINEREVFAAYGIVGDDMAAVLDETGTPAGFHPLLTGYDALPELPPELDLPPLPGEVLEHLAQHRRIAAPPAELARHKARLRALYEAGPGAKDDDDPAEDSAGGSDDEGEAALSGAHIPIPTETFLEELSVKMQLHPISVYHLLQELRAEGTRCKPEERRLLEDRLSVLVLRLLGHRWPRQLEAGEPVPDWADPDGIIPLGAVAGQSSLAERVRARLRAEDGDLGAQRAEALLAELTGQSLEDWLRREFFKRHIKQFKYRPIAWHLASDPSVAVAADAKARKRLGGRRQPAFECLVYYHACGGELLARLRTQYVEPLLRAARQQLEQATRSGDEATSVQATMRIQELEEFARRLVHVAERGFACPELDTLLAAEPLDRWSGDGYLAPADQGELLRQEQGWRVDLNDGVRVNIAPLQQAGLLAADVLKAADAKKAIADRARWRSDERRWVRAGKLPRCGWLPESVLESPAWADLAPQRAAEQAKLEEKRRAAKLPES